MYRTLFKFTVTTITILTVNLIINKTSDYLLSFKSHYHPLTYTLVAMGIITLIFYPLFAKLEDWLNVLSTRIVKSGKSYGGKYLGLLLMFLACLSVLFYFYAKMWYNIDVIRFIFQGKLGMFV
jgi:hypothetical protein